MRSIHCQEPQYLGNVVYVLNSKRKFRLKTQASNFSWKKGRSGHPGPTFAQANYSEKGLQMVPWSSSLHPMVLPMAITCHSSLCLASFWSPNFCTKFEIEEKLKKKKNHLIAWLWIKNSRKGHPASFPWDFVSNCSLLNHRASEVLLIRYMEILFHCGCFSSSHPNQ